MSSKQGNHKGLNTPIPVRYRCKVGGEWKPIQAFSKNQQRLIERQVSGIGKVDAANSGMTCLEHSAAFRGELRCDLCQLIKPYTDFSKNMRKTDDPMCKRCTAWTETQEPGVAPSPLETGHITHEEAEENRERKPWKMPADFFPSDTLPQAPITSFSAMGIHGKLSATLSSGRGPASDAGSLPPHLVSCVKSAGSEESDTGGENDGSKQKGFQKLSKSSSGTGTTASSVSGASSGRLAGSDRQATSSAPGFDELPPHLRPRGQSSKSGQVPFVGGFRGRATFTTDSASISTATTVREGRAEFEFNAWDSTGQRHEAVKIPTERSASSASNDTAENDVKAGDDWTTVPVTKRKGGWHKAPRYRSEQESPNQASGQRLDVGVDRQRLFNY